MKTIDDNCIRLCEWASMSDHNLTQEQRREISETMEIWREINQLTERDTPLKFSGPKGETLSARQYVGVIEVSGVSIEIYPKLDSLLLDQDLIKDRSTGESVMKNLLWMLEVSNFMGIKEAGVAQLEEIPTSFFDLFAYLLVKNLHFQLEQGIPHSYLTIEDDSNTVRGRIRIINQVTRNWNRYDRISCAWHEFTPDIPLNQLFKCACRFLAGRVVHPTVATLLIDCLNLLDEVTDVDPVTALRNVEFFRGDRSTDRFKICLEMAKRLIAGMGYNFGKGEADTFVFLLDMNQLFEQYVQAILEAVFKVTIEAQKFIGTLFINPNRIQQFPDFYWKSNGITWIGDAKYKHLAKGQNDALQFIGSFADEKSEFGQTKADRLISPEDVRQLTVYAELARKRQDLKEPARIMIIYPFIGKGRFETARAVTWNGSDFFLTPIKVIKQPHLVDVLPKDVQF